MSKDLKSRGYFQPGDVVSIPFGGVLQHYGVVTSRGTVISNSRKHDGVTEQSLEDFADGRRIKLHNSGSDAHHLEIEARARRALGASYRLAGSNCGDFVGHVHRRKPTVTQVGRAAVMALGDLMSNSRRYR
jgi:hypothetical protein